MPSVHGRRNELDKDVASSAETVAIRTEIIGENNPLGRLGNCQKARSRK